MSQQMKRLSSIHESENDVEEALDLVETFHDDIDGPSNDSKGGKKFSDDGEMDTHPKSTNLVRKKNRNGGESTRRLSHASRAYDRGDKGYLDKTERILRNYDVDGDGKISLQEVFRIVEDLSAHKTQKRNLKKYLWISVGVGLVLLISMFGLMWATIVLTRQVTVQGPSLVSSQTGQMLKTKASGSVLKVSAGSPDERRRLNNNGLDVGKLFVGFVNKAEFAAAFSTNSNVLETTDALSITFEISVEEPNENDNGFTTQIHHIEINKGEYTETQYSNGGFRISGLKPVNAQTSATGDEFDQTYSVDCPHQTNTNVDCEIYETIPFVPVVSGVTTSQATIWYQCTEDVDISVRYGNTVAQLNNNYKKFPDTDNGDEAHSHVATKDNDYTGSITLTGLSANTKYYYKLFFGSEEVTTSFTNNIGIFNTFPGPSESFSFTVFADAAHYYMDQSAKVYKEGGNKENNHLFALQIGDFDHSDPANLEEVRIMNRELRNPSRQHGRILSANILTKMSFTHIWDDHDYCGQDTDRFCDFRSDTMQAYKEYYPGYELAQPDEGLWFSFLAGDAEIFVLDTRSQRDPDLWPDPETGTWEKSMLNGRMLDDSKSQLKWLEDGLTSSTAKWKILISTITANIHARPSNLDHWMTGFEGEARKIRDMISANAGLQESTVMISADLHSGGVIDDGCNNGFGIPEIGVPHTNLVEGNEDNIGSWNVASNHGNVGSGFAEISVTADSLTMKVIGKDGKDRGTHTLPFTATTGCFEAKYDVEGGLTKCTRNVHQFRPPKPEQYDCIGGKLNGTTLAYEDFRSNVTDAQLINEVKFYECPASGRRIIVSNNIPDHEITRDNKNRPCIIPWFVDMPLQPEVMETVDKDGNTVELKFEPSSVVGLAMNGVVAYNTLEAGSANAVSPGEGDVEDAKYWYGHADEKNVQHYHAPWLGRDEADDLDSAELLGYAMDGFPIYGPVDDPEGTLDVCNFNTQTKDRYHVRKLDQVDTDLDYCNGNDEAVNWKYIIGCFRGNPRNTVVKSSESATAVLYDDCVEVSSSY